MRRSSTRYLLPALAILLVVGCSTNKDAFLNRTFHKLVTRDNGWFNANEKLKETVAAMQKAHVDDYDLVLPIFVNGTEEEARAMVPELEICIEKCATAIDRNPWSSEEGEEHLDRRCLVRDREEPLLQAGLPRCLAHLRLYRTPVQGTG